MKRHVFLTGALTAFCTLSGSMNHVFAAQTSSTNDTSKIQMAIPYPGFTVHMGSHGEIVVGIQQRLNTLGFPAGPTDGDFGPLTRKAVQQFQQTNKLKADGVVGAQTWADLFPVTSTSSLLSSVQRYAETRSSDISVAVYDVNNQQTYVYNPYETFATASIVKTLILATLLHQGEVQHVGLTSQERLLAVPMIEQSNNDAATRLWDMAGQSSGVGKFIFLAQMVDTAPNSYGYWGLTTTSALDQVMLLKTFVDSNPLLNSSDRDYVLGLMNQVVSWQRWGVSAGVPNTAYVALKNGWLPLSAGDWEINSTGYVNGNGRNYVIAVLTRNNPSEQYGISTTEGISRIIWSTLVPSTTMSSHS